MKAPIGGQTSNQLEEDGKLETKSLRVSKMVRRFKIESDAFLVCMTHALSTEQEEVMGLLIGEISEDGISHAHAVIMLRRSDKRKDRVEISPEQLSNASTKAEISFLIGQSTRAKKPLRIIGWYHSHPHITVWPSHVDVRTQSMYQMMDQDFVGLIISCFNEDPTTSVGDVQVTCFQAAQTGSYSQLERLEIELEIVPSMSISDATLAALVELPVILEEEESEAYMKTLSHKMQDLVTAIHNGTVYTRAICQLLSVICAPLIQTLERQLKRRTLRLDELKAEKINLENQIAKVKE